MRDVASENKVGKQQRKTANLNPCLHTCLHGEADIGTENSLLLLLCIKYLLNETLYLYLDPVQGTDTIVVRSF